LETSRDELLRPVLPDDALYGLPGEVALTLSKSTGADPASILSMFLTMFGNAVGRQPHVTFYGHEEPARFFTLIVGKWARGRKGTAFTAVRKLFIPAEPEWAANRIEPGLQSPEALIEAVADSPTGDPRLLVLETEFARFIATMQTARRFSSQMRTAYDGEQLSRKRVTKQPLIATQHHISLIGMITPGELNALSKLSGGLESRMLYVYSAPGRKTEADPFSDAEDEMYLAEKVKSAINRAWDYILEGSDPISAELAKIRGIAPNTKFSIADDVADNWREQIAMDIEALADDIGEDFERYTARGQTQVIRLALAYALADGQTEIDWPHVNAAMALWEFCARSARRIFSVPDNPDPRVNPKYEGRVYDYLRTKHPEWTSMTEITNNVLKNNATASVIVDDLEEQGLVEVRRIAPKGKGRPQIDARVVIN
jgi:Protein of unknown function (DUF3987)